jgi:hypothetical protein
MYLCADIIKLKEFVGWEVKINLGQGIQDLTKDSRINLAESIIIAM